MVAPTRRYHVALVDPLPAGLEAVNPALATTGSAPGRGATARCRPVGPAPRHWWWWRPWFEHQNLRDERVEAFASLLWEGVYTYRYVARATTPGTFVVPPAEGRGDVHAGDLRPRRHRRRRGGVSQRPRRTERSARRSTSPGAASFTHRPSRPLTVITSIRWRFSIAVTIRRAHSSAAHHLRLVDRRRLEGLAVALQGATSDLRLDEVGRDHRDRHPGGAQLDAERVEEADLGVLGRRVPGAARGPR